MDHAKVMNNCDAKAERVGLTSLTEVERVVVLVSRANFEIELGGFDSFYYNSSGDKAVQTVAALQVIGATQAASTLREANSLFPGALPPIDNPTVPVVTTIHRPGESTCLVAYETP